MLKQVVSLGLVLGLGVGCSDRHASPQNQVQAPNGINESFVIMNAFEPNDADAGAVSNASEAEGSSEASTRSRFKIGIKRSALDKEFLFHGSMIAQSPLPMFQGMKSRVVAFKQVGSNLIMLEATQGHTVSNSLPQEFVIAAFPIIEGADGGDHLFFDFSEGLNKVYVAGDWHVQDYSGSEYQDSWTSATLGLSYIADAKFTDNELVVRQVGQVTSKVQGLDANEPVELRYYLSPYKPNPGFVSTRTTMETYKKFGFFEVAPQLQTLGPEVTFASKFDHRQPIEFGISANTPAEYRQAVRDGILYWNKAFGREILKAKVLPEGVSAPDHRHNVIQWVNWDDAGFAYADAQMDPRTGEIKHAQVFMTSAFAFGGKSRARKLLRRMDHLSRQHAAHKKTGVVSLVGFTRSNLCHHEPDAHLRTALETVASFSDEVDSATILKLAQDYVREVVAHEVGHTLGLRHNFAGSLAMNFPQSVKEEVFQKYLTQGQAPADVITSSSVMEYQRFEESVITGDQMTRPGAALSYDEKAVKHLYDGQEFDETPLFCTDSHVEEFMDCNRFDSGPSILEFLVWQQRETLKNLPFVMMESYIGAKSPLPGHDSRPLVTATLDPKVTAASALSSRQSALGALKAGKKLLKVRRDFDVINAFNEAEVSAKEEEVIVEEFGRYQVFEKLLSPATGIDLVSIQAAFERLLDHPSFEAGVGPGGVGYEFTYADKDVMKKQGQLFFVGLRSALLQREMEIFAETKGITTGAAGKQVFDKFVAVARDVVLATDGHYEATVARGGESIELRLPKFKYPTALRAQAASLVLSRWVDPVWGLYERASLQADLKQLLKEGLQAEIATAQPSSYVDRSVARWILDNKSVLSKLHPYAAL